MPLSAELADTLDGVTDVAADRREDIVGDRAALISIGMVAVAAACGVFAVLRLVLQLATGHATPWWGNAAAGVIVGALFFWYRRDPVRRSAVAVHGTAAVATLALLIPVAYGMDSSKWWLALVGFAVLLMGRRGEALVWGAITLALIPLASILEPRLIMANAAPESPAERAAAGLAFGVLLLGMTWAFRRVAQDRARELTETAASLVRANLVKTRFLAHVSHEVRTPLHGVIAMTDMALEGDASPEVREQIQSAQQSARMLLSLLNNILDIARAESDSFELDDRPFPLHAALSEVLRPLAAQARAKGLAFSARAEPGIVERRIGDRGRFTQIVLNLVGNALKFTKAGRIEVRLRPLPGHDDHLALDVSDTGSGIPADRLAAIFEPFTQASAADASVQGGAGLGLAIVRDLARRMGGTVRVESEAGKGATFTVELRLPRADDATNAGPADLLPVSAPPPLRRAPVPTAPLHVLVCEDNPVNQKVLLAMLARLGHTTTVAGDGLAAWEILQHQSFDLLLTDLEMPGLDGLELARRVRTREAEGGAPRLPIIGATAHVSEEEQHRLLRAGMDAHLGKPFTLSDLVAVLARTAATPK